MVMFLVFVNKKEFDERVLAVQYNGVSEIIVTLIKAFKFAR